jgi:small subunit ribosomal protein S1
MNESLNLRTKALGSVGLADDDFDWSGVGNRYDSYKSDEKARLEDMYDKTLMTVAEHQIVNGTVISISEKDVVVKHRFQI